MANPIAAAPPTSPTRGRPRSAGPFRAGPDRGFAAAPGSSRPRRPQRRLRGRSQAVAGSLHARRRQFCEQPDRGRARQHIIHAFRLRAVTQVPRSPAVRTADGGRACGMSPTELAQARGGRGSASRELPPRGAEACHDRARSLRNSPRLTAAERPVQRDLVTAASARSASSAILAGGRVSTPPLLVALADQAGQPRPPR